MRCACTRNSRPPAQAAALSGGMLLRQSTTAVLLRELNSIWAAEALPVGPSIWDLSATGAPCMISGCHRLPTTCGKECSTCEVR